MIDSFISFRRLRSSPNGLRATEAHKVEYETSFYINFENDFSDPV